MNFYSLPVSLTNRTKKAPARPGDEDNRKFSKRYPIVFSIFGGNISQNFSTGFQVNKADMSKEDDPIDYIKTDCQKKIQGFKYSFRPTETPGFSFGKRVSAASFVMDLRRNNLLRKDIRYLLDEKTSFESFKKTSALKKKHTAQNRESPVDFGQQKIQAAPQTNDFQQRNIAPVPQRNDIQQRMQAAPQGNDGQQRNIVIRPQGKPPQMRTQAGTQQANENQPKNAAVQQEEDVQPKNAAAQANDNQLRNVEAQEDDDDQPKNEEEETEKEENYNRPRYAGRGRRFRRGNRMFKRRERR